MQDVPVAMFCFGHWSPIWDAGVS